MFLCVADCTLLTLPLGWLVRDQVMANVSTVRWHRFFSCGGIFFMFYPEALALEVVLVVVKGCQKMFVSCQSVSG